MDTTIEQESMRAAAGGDLSAREAIVRAHYERIHRLARHHAEAQDLAQQTFLQACKNAGRYDGRSSVRAWLVGILLHEFSRWRRGRRIFVELREGLSAGPANQILDREVLLNAIHRLSAPLCSTFLLVEVNGLSVLEAAAVLNVPEGTVMSRLSEARIKLRRSLGDPETPSSCHIEVSNES